jgi:AraC-like DNA-binding protein
MALLLDTRSVALADRREAWADVHARALFPLSIDFAHGRAFEGRAEAREVGAATLLRFRGGASTVRRTPQTIRLGDPGHLVVALALDGSCAVRQGDRAAVLRPGDVTTWDSSRPFAVPHAGAFDLLLASVPHDRVAHRSGPTATRADGPAARRAAAFLRALWGTDVPARDPGELVEALGQTARSVQAAGAGRFAAPPDGAAVLSVVVRADIESRLGDRRLSPATLARAHAVSVRHLQAVFAAQGATVSGHIRARRLQRARADLADARLAHLSIARIADRWGFVSAAHFSRAFRAAYGHPPRAERSRGG